MLRRYSRLFCFLLALALSCPGQSKTSGQKIQFEDLRLKNGLRVLLSEDHSAPVYSIAVIYNVGSRNEVNGRTGFAHLFEHMMFQGSENVGKGEHMLLVQENGGGMNGTTSEDRTLYFESLPANQLDLGLFLEADRMRALAVNETNLDNQRNAVQEERRLGVDNQPYGTTFERLNSIVFDDPPYSHSVIGSMEDLNAARVEDVKQFFKIYYAPNNAVLAIVGDFDKKGALEKIQKYFGSIPKQPAPVDVVVHEAKQTAERRVTIEDSFARLPRLTILYKTVPANTPDDYALQTLLTILADGQSSRLYQKLVKEQQVAVNVGAFEDGMRGVGRAQISVTPRPDKDMAGAEKLVYEEIDRLKKEPPSDEEIAKVRAIMRFRRVQALQYSLQRAIRLGQNALYFNDPDLINTLEQKFAAVTKQDLLRVANQYLEAGNRNIVITLPKPKAAPQPAGN
jgi:zinc protease